MESWTPNLSWVEPDLAVGGCFPIERAAVLASQHGVGAVVDVRRETCDDAEHLEGCGLRFLHLPTWDMQGVSQKRLDAGVAFARRARREGLRVLIHCEHGIGRSALLALCVMVDRGAAPLEALLRAKDARGAISPCQAQYDAWARWLDRRSKGPAPSYHEFGMIAYRHLAASG